MSIITADQPAGQTKQRDTLNRVLAEYDVKIVPSTVKRKARETQARQTLKKIYAKLGPAHMRDVLTCIVESNCEANAFALTAPIIKAVSRILRAHAHWYERDASAWLRVFDETDLTAVLDDAKGNRAAAALPDAVADTLCKRLRIEFEERVPGVARR